MKLEELCEKVTIIEIAEHYGYQFQRGEGTRVPVYHHESGDKIGILGPNSDNQGYFSMHDPSDKGRLYNFIKNKMSKGIIPTPLTYPKSNSEYNCVMAVLHNYLNVPMEVRERNKETIKFLQTRERSEPVDFQAQLAPLENKGFLYSRGFYNSTIDNALFKGRIFGLTGDHNKYNIGLPIWEGDKMVGLEQRNQGLHRFYTGSQKANGIWHSNIPEKIMSVFVAESPLDCLAHRQLKGDDNTLYISFGGNLCATQILTINKLLNEHRDKVDAKNFKFRLGADNDSAGTNYDLQFLRTQICLQGHPSDYLGTGDPSRMRIVVHYKDDASLEKASLMSGMVAEGVRVEADKEKRMLHINFPNDMFAKRSICEAMLKTHNLPHTVLEKAVMKDWNDDVLVLKDINKQGAKIAYKEFSDNKEKYMEDCEVFEQKRLEKKQEQKQRKGPKM